MKKHVTTVAILQIVYGVVVNLIGALVIGLVFNFVKQFVDDQIALNVLNYISIPIAVWFLILGGLRIAGAIGLFYYRNWARILTLIMAGLGLMNIPLGTLLGVYIIWALVQPEAVKLFEEEKLITSQQ